MRASDDEPGRLERLEQQMQGVTQRLAALEEAAASRRAAPGAGLWGTGPDPGPGPGEPDSEETVFGYSGRGWIGGKRMVIHQRARLSDVLDAEPDLVAKVFAALASPARILVLRALLDGPRTSQELRQELDDPSVGQLYHHLRELLAAGLIIQPGRSMYAIPRGSEVALCVQIIAAAHLMSAGRPYPPPAPGSADDDPPPSEEGEE